jgi:hypothetical protein
MDEVYRRDVQNYVGAPTLHAMRETPKTGVPISCPGCGADHRPLCRYCGRQNEAPRMYVVDPEIGPDALAAIRAGVDGMTFQRKAAERARARRRSGLGGLIASIF